MKTYQEYSMVRNVTKFLVAKRNKEFWQMFDKCKENYLYGLLNQLWQLLRQKGKRYQDISGAKRKQPD